MPCTAHAVGGREPARQKRTRFAHVSASAGILWVVCHGSYFPAFQGRPGAGFQW